MDEHRNLALTFQAENLNLQRKLQALEASVKEDYDKITRRILVLESIFLKEFGSDAIVGGEKVIHLLDKNMMRLRSSKGEQPPPAPPRKESRASASHGIPPKKRGRPGRKSTTASNSVSGDEYTDLIKIGKSTPRLVPKNERGEVGTMEDNVISESNNDGGFPEFICHGMEEDAVAGRDVAVVVEHNVSGDMQDIIITRSGRRSKPNPKFDWAIKEEVEEPEEITAELNWDEDEDDDVRSIESNSGSTGQHQCDLCGRSMSTSSNLRVHRRRCGMSSRQWKFACDFCNEKFPTEFKRNYHTKIHTEDRPYKCEVPGCSSAFKFNVQLSIHRRVHQSTRKYACSVCGKTYKHKSGLNLHMMMHKQLKIFGCIMCEKKFYTRTHVKRHLRQFHKCEDEDIEIPKDETLLEPPPPKKAKSTVGRKTPRRIVERVICDQCGACVLKNNFKHHLSTHEILVNCDQCGKGFSTEFGLKSHVEHAHDLDKPFMCNFPECESRFNSVSNLRTHQVSHTDERRYRCEPCNRSYKHKGGLKVHINSCHSKDKQFPCSVCSRVFDTRTHLKRHVIKVHGIEAEEAEKITKVEKIPKGKPQRQLCDLCPKTYKTKHDLRLHKNAAHTHETNFPCPYCSKVFYRKNHQKRHLSKVHNFKEEPSEDSPQMKLDEMDLTAVEVDMEEIPTSSTGSTYPVLQSFQLKPGTVVEIIEYDGETIHNMEETSYKS